MGHSHNGRSAETINNRARDNICYVRAEQERMSFVHRFLKRVGRSSDEDRDTYRCIRCDTGFDRRYHECPECGVRHVVSETTRTDE